MVRSSLLAASGVITGWLLAGFPLAWIGLTFGVIAALWWLLRRRTWQKCTATHVVLGALLLANFKRRYQASGNELEISLLEKVEQNTTKFAKNYESWVGQPLARRVG